MSAAMNLIQAERNRQIQAEQFDPGHDDDHVNGELFQAANAYLENHLGNATKNSAGVPANWPFEAEWFKPRSPIQDLTRAGALFLAEKERLLRISADIAPVDEKLNLTGALLQRYL